MTVGPGSGTKSKFVFIHFGTIRDQIIHSYKYKLYIVLEDIGVLQVLLPLLLLHID